jgi:riboflavin transporter FmnP
VEIAEIAGNFIRGVLASILITLVKKSLTILLSPDEGQVGIAVE